ncbi:MAG: Ig-like domain-containing protein, partial [Terriglobia bacterium]
HANALHASGLPVGTPGKDSPYAGMGTFVPHVIVRNLLGSPQSVTIMLGYPQPASGNSQNFSGIPPAAQSGGSSNPKMRIIPAPPVPGDSTHHPEWGAGIGTTTATFTLAPTTVPAYGTEDISLASVLAQLPLPLPLVSVRIQFNGVPGSVEAQVSSVEQRGDLVADAKVQNEGNGWAGSGGNPWHLDNQTESILFLTNESGQPARIGFKVWANGTVYYLTRLRLAPHETRAMDLRKLRDAQQPDIKGNKIPAGATDGSVNWIRADNVPVMGRLMVINRSGGIASAYDCCNCSCPLPYGPMSVSPASECMSAGDQCQLTATEYTADCNNSPYEYDVTDSCDWASMNSSVATVSSKGLAKAVAHGTASLEASMQNVCTAYVGHFGTCTCNGYGQGSGYCDMTVGQLSGFAVTVTSTPVTGETNPLYS